MKANILTYIFLLLASALSAQGTSSILLRNSLTTTGQVAIDMKWYSPELYYKEGVNIYRKDGGGTWQKLNTVPVKRLKDLPEQAYQNDDELHFFIPLINKAKKEDVQGLLLFQVLVKSWESEAFSKFLGIFYQDTTVELGKSYSYKVTKIIGAREELIGESAPFTSGAGNIQEPLKDVSVKADTNKTKIRWLPEEQRFFGVNIYRSKDSLQWEKVKTRPLVISKYRDSTGIMKYPETFYVDDSLETGFYYYQLTGVDFFGQESKRSPTVKVDIKVLIPPPPPFSLKDSIRGLEVSLFWDNPVSTDVDGINIYKSVKSSGPFNKINKQLLPSNTTTYIDKVLKPGPYYYYVSTVDKAGNEAASRPVFAEVHDIVPPIRPSGLIARADTGKVHLTWQKNREGDLSGYMIYRTSNLNDKNNFVLLNAQPIKENTFIDRLPKNAKNQFLYKILAIDSSYNKSEYSDVVTVKLPDVTPPVRPLIKNLKNVDRSIMIEWLPNKDADLNGYNMYRKIGKEKDFIKINTSMIVLNEVSFVDKDIRSGSTYYYYLTAVDSVGNESQPSGIQKASANSVPQEIAPKDIRIKYKAEKNELQISWKHERSEDLLGFVVYRRHEGAEEFRPLSGKSTGKAYLDKDVKKGETYFYQIRAYDKMGNILRSEVKKVVINK